MYELRNVYILNHLMVQSSLVDEGKVDDAGYKTFVLYKYFQYELWCELMITFNLPCYRQYSEGSSRTFDMILCLP